MPLDQAINRDSPQRETRGQSENIGVAAAQDRAQLPTYLYRHFDKDGRLLYVGIALSTLTRTAQHRDGSHWFGDIRRIEVEQHPSRLDALEAERVAITREKPLHNIMRPKPRHAADPGLPSPEEDSRRGLMRRLVTFNPLYTMDGAAKALDISTGLLKKLIDGGKIGTVRIGDTRTRITGWQIIEFLEAAEAGQI